MKEKDRGEPNFTLVLRAYNDGITGGDPERPLVDSEIEAAQQLLAVFNAEQTMRQGGAMSRATDELKTEMSVRTLAFPVKIIGSPDLIEVVKLSDVLFMLDQFKQANSDLARAAIERSPHKAELIAALTRLLRQAEMTDDYQESTNGTLHSSCEQARRVLGDGDYPPIESLSSPGQQEGLPDQEFARRIGPFSN